MSELQFIARDREWPRGHPGFDDRSTREPWNRQAVWCRACAVVHQKASHCPILVRARESNQDRDPATSPVIELHGSGRTVNAEKPTPESHLLDDGDPGKAGPPARRREQSTPIRPWTRCAVCGYRLWTHWLFGVRDFYSSTSTKEE